MTAVRARCSFYLRTAVTGGYRYDPIPIDTPLGQFATAHPPLVGDLVYWPGGTFVVVQRSWMYSAYGSADWPHGESVPKVGPLLTLIVEDAHGPFVDEVAAPDDDEEQP